MNDQGDAQDRDRWARLRFSIIGPLLAAPPERGELRAALLAGERKIDRWTARFGCAEAAWLATPYDPFFNANTPDDVAEAEALARLAP